MSANRLLIVFAVLAVAGCASTPAHKPVPATHDPSPVPQSASSLFARIPSQIGLFKLTERSALSGAPGDSLFRFRDGSKTNLSVIVYAVNVALDERTDTDPQKLTMLEGEKFREAQAVQQKRGRIHSYVMGFSDTTRFTAGSRTLLEHRIAMPTRYPNGLVTVEMQFVYLIEDKFVKVRGTIPEQGWQQTRVPSFARELALRIAGGT